ncbi:MAG: DNA polymerase II large subunit [Halobacteriales archaeon]
MREADERYFDRIERQVEDAFSVARTAKGQGKDPEPDVEIPVAKDMADRVENLLGIDGVADRVRELDSEMSREEAALELARDFAEGRVGEYETREGKIEGAVRTAVALLTEGVVAAPIEGIDRVELLENDDGTEFVRIFYAGPIRSAGGTAQALSVLVADYARSILGIDRYKPREEEVERYAEEIDLYDEETGLQYTPKPAETKFIARHCPIMLDGESTGAEEVSGYRDLERVDTNSPRGGMCLVLAEGIALKVPKIQRYTDQLEEVEWPWLEDLKEDAVTDGGTTTGPDTDAEAEAGAGPEADSDSDLATEPADADAGTAETAPPSEEAEADDTSGTRGDDLELRAPPRADPNKKFLRDLIAGRPVFSHPSADGGFRLRYGRARNHGHATAGVHPATMHLVDDFLAAGTQIKTECPGKAAGVVPVDSIEGPTVKLATGEVRRIDDPDEAREIRNGVTDILDLGEYLVNYGEFVENNHPLAPASYVVEWWEQDVAAAGGDLQALRDDPSVDLVDPSAEQAIEWAQEFDVPLHPAYTYLWHDIDVAAFESLATAVTDGRLETTADGRMLTLAATDDLAETLEALLIEHTQGDAAIMIPDPLALLRSLGVTADLERTWTDLPASAREWPNAMRAVNAVAPFEIRERAPTRIGNRMGRPEKSEVRELNPAVHTLFPIGEDGGDQRDVAAAATHAEGMQDTPGQITVDVGRRRCPACGTETYTPACPECDGHTELVYSCPDCEIEVEPDESGRTECTRCGRTATAVEPREIDLHTAYREALAAVGERENAFEMLKGVKGLSSTAKTPEPIEKGVLRAKHGVSTFKDGTVRYDMTDLPVTSVRPAEIDVSVGQLRALGYETDIHGDPLQYDDQLVELRVQDVILSDGAAEHMMQVADFVDDLLVSFYDLEPFYELDDRDDLVGELVFGMAPHTSAAVVGRIVGFTSAAVGYAHPYFHASKRRNCFHPDTKLWFEDEDGAWHYGRIDEFVEERLDDPETDDFGTLVSELDGSVRVPSLAGNGDLVPKPVDAVSKHQAPDHMVRIETRSGREITVTPDHEVHVFENGRIRSRRASEMSETDHVIKPRPDDAIDPSSDAPVFDLLDEFIDSDSIDNDRLMIKGLEKSTLYDLFERSLADDHVGRFYPVTSTAECFDLSHKTVRNYLYRGSVPASLLIELFDSMEALLSFVPADVSLGVEGDRTEVDRFVQINDRVATLLGYYAAAGFARAQATPKGSIHQVTICDTEPEARDFFIEAFEGEFGADPPRENDAGVTVSGRLVQAFFDTILNAGVLAHEKRVPQSIFDAPDPIVAAYLRGYFSGAGTVDSNGLGIHATTIGRELKEDLLALLSRLDIVAQVDIREPVRLRDRFPDYYEPDDPAMVAPRYVISISSEDANTFADIVGFHLSRKGTTLDAQNAAIDARGRRVFDGGDGDYLVEAVASIEYTQSTIDYTYCLTVADSHSLITNDLSSKQCDGDEDCIMLLMDGLLNFSKYYLPDKRGGKMDAPLVMSSRIDPTEIDDEAHNIDIVEQYPREFYEATRRLADPDSVDITIAEATLETDQQYSGFRHTHDTSNIAAGPDLSAYKTLGSMTEKMDAQLALARKLRAVDETDVAERIIEYHFLPDLLGNLRAFSRQETRCLDCGTKYRRVPLTGACRECGGDMTLTVHEGSVNKYLETALEIAEEFGVREYTKQRIRILERSIERIFEDDTNKQSGIADFM